jgi:hypothetical protein
MSESDFDEQLDRVLRHRAQAEAPPSLEEHIRTMLTQQSTRIARGMWCAATVAACLLLGVFVWHRFHAPALITPQTTAHTPQSLAQAPNYAAHDDVPGGTSPHRKYQGTPHVVRQAKWDANAGARPQDTTASAYSPLVVGVGFRMTPATLRIAEHTAACALTPCSCAEMCRTSN